MKEAIQAELTVLEFLAKSGFESSPSGAARRFDTCPECGPGKAGKFWARDDFGNCNACGFSGDLFAVAGAVLDLNPKSEFPAILKACAAMAGVSEDYDSATIQKKLEARRRQREHEEREAKAYRERAERGAADVWASLAKRSREGQEYLAARGILPQLAGSECRYGSKSVCLPLWRDGQIVSVVGRRFDGGSPKVRGLAGCGTLGTFGRPVRRQAHAGPVVVVEGLFDYLSARQMSPTRLVLGAHGALRLEYVAQVAAELIKGTGLGLVFTPHQDTAGIAAVERAKVAAIEAGVAQHVITEFRVADDCNDLNDHLGSHERRAA